VAGGGRRIRGDQEVESSVYLTSRLAPDQFAFAKQVQSACDVAKLIAAR